MAIKKLRKNWNKSRGKPLSNQIKSERLNNVKETILILIGLKKQKQKSMPSTMAVFQSSFHIIPKGLPLQLYNYFSLHLRWVG